MLVHARMYAIGEKYIIPALKDLAKRYFSETVILQSGASLGTSIHEAYTTTPDSDRGLRDVVLTFTRHHITSLVQGSEFCRLAVEAPRFGFVLLQHTVEKVVQQNARSYKTGDCYSGKKCKCRGAE